MLGLTGKIYWPHNSGYPMTSTPTPGTDELVAYLEHESRSTVSAEVRSETRRRILDTLASIAGGYQLPESETIAAYTHEQFTGGSATLLDGSGRTLTVPGATLANSVAANALDIDDGCVTSLGHPAAVVVPAALAGAEAVDATVGEFIDAVIPAYEIAVRCAVALHESTGCYTGSGSWGSVGAAAALASLREYDEGRTAAALEIAEFNGPLTPIMRSVANPGSGMTKDGIGWGGYVGATAADMAGLGLAGSGTAFDTIEHDVTIEEPLDSLGDRYFLLESFYKPYPGCRWIHAAIDAIQTLHEEHDIDAGDVEAIRVYTHRKATELATVHPETADQAQYSYPYLVAVTIVQGHWPHPADLLAERRNDPAVIDLARRVSLHVDEAADERFPDQLTARVEIDVGGRTLGSSLTIPRGAPERPMTATEHEQKRRILLQYTVGEDAFAAVADRLHEPDTPVKQLLEPWRDQP